MVILIILLIIAGIVYGYPHVVAAGILFLGLEWLFGAVRRTQSWEQNPHKGEPGAAQQHVARVTGWALLLTLLVLAILAFGLYGRRWIPPQ